MFMEDDDGDDSGEEFITVNKSKNRRRRKADVSTDKLLKKAIDTEAPKQHCSNSSGNQTPNQVPALKSKSKSKKQKSSDQKRREKGV